MRCFIQDCLESRPGALGSAVIAGGVKIKLLAIWLCRNQSMAKGASEDRLAHFVGQLERDTGVPRDCLPAAMNDRVGWRKRALAARYDTG